MKHFIVISETNFDSSVMAKESEFTVLSFFEKNVLKFINFMYKEYLQF